MSKISPLAFIDPEAKIGENCEIGPFCFIDKNVEIGDNNVLMNSVSVLYGARIGNGNVIFPGAVISAVPQDLNFRGEETMMLLLETIVSSATVPNWPVKSSSTTTPSSVPTF